MILNCKMAGTGTHLSVHVRSGCQILLTKISFTLLDVMFTELFLHLSKENEHVGEQRVAKVIIADLAAVDAPRWIWPPPSLCAWNSTPSTSENAAQIPILHVLFLFFQSIGPLLRRSLSNNKLIWSGLIVLKYQSKAKWSRRTPKMAHSLGQCTCILFHRTTCILYIMNCNQYLLWVSPTAPQPLLVESTKMYLSCIYGARTTFSQIDFTISTK